MDNSTMPDYMSGYAEEWNIGEQALIGDEPVEKCGSRFLSFACECGATRHLPEAACGNCDSETVHEILCNPGFLPYAKNPGLLSGKAWFHATSLPDWHEAVVKNSVPVHIGFESTSCAIGRSLYHEDGGYWFYELELSIEAGTAPYLCPDLRLDWPDTMTQFENERHGKPDFIGYVNCYEDHGSISLISDPSKLVVKSRQWVEVQRQQ